MAPPDVRVPRTLPTVLAVSTVLAGLGARAFLPDDVAGPVGDALYAALLVWLVALVAPAVRPATAAALALLVATAVELSHLTDVPSTVLDRFPLARYALGTTFSAADVLWYALGAALAGAVLALARPRAAVVDEALRHVRERRRPRARWVAAVVVPLAVLGAVGAAGVGVERALRLEAGDLTAQVVAARSELADAEGKVADPATRTALSDALDAATALLADRPVLDRGPGDAAAAGDRLEQAAATVHASRRTFATEQIGAQRETVAPVRRRAERILAATGRLADAGTAASEAARTALRDAVGTADEAVSATAADRLDAMALDELEDAAPDLSARRDDVDRATTALMVAQDAVSCPEDDQRWWPRGGHLDDDELAPIPWAPEHEIRADLVDGLVALDEAYRAEFGVHLTVNSAYRSYDQQLAVHDPQDPNPLAAPPGCSNHGLGTAVDLSMGPGSFDGAPYLWLQEHAGEFGWQHPGWAGPAGRLPEPWHWESVETPTEY